MKENRRAWQRYPGALKLLSERALTKVSLRCLRRLNPDRSALAGVRAVKDYRVIRGQHPAANHQNGGEQQCRQAYARLHMIRPRQPVCR